MPRTKKKPARWTPTVEAQPRYRVVCREINGVDRYVLEIAQYADEGFSVYRFQSSFATSAKAHAVGQYFVADPGSNEWRRAVAHMQETPN